MCEVCVVQGVVCGAGYTCVCGAKKFNCARLKRNIHVAPVM